MMQDSAISKSIRVGIFGTFSGADQAVQGLIDGGFTKEEITVICPENLKGEFAPFEHKKDTTQGTIVASATGGAIGAALGGLALLTGVVATGGIGLLVAGPLLAGSALTGGFVGLMATRGVKMELARFYDQAVTSGKILVAAEVQDKAPEERLTLAESILSVGGVKPMGLSAG